MEKSAYFNSRRRQGWPSLEELEPYFLAPAGQEWFSTGGNDSGGLTIEGLYDTEHLDSPRDRIDAHLSMDGKPGLGVMLLHRKVGAGHQENNLSVFDLTRLQERVENLEGYLMPRGLYIPFERAWSAVKEFIETEGRLPRSIEWIASRDLPPDTFKW